MQRIVEILVIVYERVCVCVCARARARADPDFNSLLGFLLVDVLAFIVKRHITFI